MFNDSKVTDFLKHELEEKHKYQTYSFKDESNHRLVLQAIDMKKTNEKVIIEVSDEDLTLKHLEHSGDSVYTLKAHKRLIMLYEGKKINALIFEYSEPIATVKERMSREELTLACVQMVRGFEDLHADGKVLRDVNMNNIRVDGLGHIKISGLLSIKQMKLEVFMQKKYEQKGTPPFMNLASCKKQLQSYRDSMESLVLVMWALLSPDTFPSESLQGGVDLEKRIKFLHDLSTSEENPTFAKMIRHCRSCEYHRHPDYNEIIKMLPLYGDYKKKIQKLRLYIPPGPSLEHVTRALAPRRRISEGMPPGLAQDDWVKLEKQNIKTWRVVASIQAIKGM